MRNTLLQIIVLLLGIVTTLQAQDRQEYIERFKNIAIREMERTGVPASIKLGQGLLESGAGSSYLARKANNHFGIKCGSSWKGRKEYRKDDDYDENGVLQKSCFRAYRSAEESYIAHSEFLRDPRKEHRYGFLFRYDVRDYKRWARGLKKAGYATSGTYAEKLINIIESYDLSRFDRMVSDDLRDMPLEEDDLVAGLDIRRINDVRVVLAQLNDTPDNIGNKSDVKTKCILKYNENIEQPDLLLKENEHIFLQKKRKKFRGQKKWHYIRKNETMYEVSQLYGIRLKNLYRRNLLPKGAQPMKGERVKLRGLKISAKNRPRVRANYKEPVRPTQEEKKDENWMDEENTIEPEVPTTTPTPPTNPPVITPPSTNPPPPAGEIYHTIIKGDTLYSLSRKYGVSVDAIKQLNGLTTNTIFPGNRLRIK